MKLAEALILRADLQTRLEQLRQRLVNNARVQEGESPAEEPMELLKEADSAAAQLEALIARIHLTNAHVVVDGKTLTELLARREVLTTRISLLQGLLDSASSTVMRGSRTEVKILPAVDVKALRKQADGLSQELRKLDTVIQSRNWLEELQ